MNNITTTNLNVTTDTTNIIKISENDMDIDNSSSQSISITDYLSNIEKKYAENLNLVKISISKKLNCMFIDVNNLNFQQKVDNDNFNIYNIEEDIFIIEFELDIYSQNKLCDWISEQIENYTVKSQTIGLHNWRDKSTPGMINKL